jgi:erythrin-vacuolar iron transport family protein
MSLSGIDLASLTLMDALDLAILIEEEANERYTEFVDQMELHHTPEAARFFSFMAANEQKHHAVLTARRRELFGDRPPRVSRAGLFDVEAPEFDEVRAFMTPREALQVAFRAEKKAYQFFADVAPHLRDDAVRKLFKELEAEEVHHQILVLMELEKTPPESLLKPTDVADEPVAQ